MYFKIDNTSDVFRRLKELEKQAVVANDAATELAKTLITELGETPPDNFILCASSGNLGGGCSGIALKTKPEGWKVILEGNGYLYCFPKKTKRNQSFTNRLAALPKVTKSDVNKAVGFTYQVVDNRLVTGVGLAFRGEHVLLSLADGVDYAPLPGMIEITYSEHKTLIDSIAKATVQP